MDLLGIVLAVFVGLTFGGLIVLLYDEQTLGKRIKTAVSEKTRLQQQLNDAKKTLQNSERKLAATQSHIKKVQKTVADVKADAEARTAEVATLQNGLKMAHAEIEVLQGNLARVMEHTDS
ncbi:MAG: hypothetical protein GY943_30230, partial [Chloroflexi bacterium]|nr:hypothetical protein [Chloroflexota bacterium]